MQSWQDVLSERLRQQRSQQLERHLCAFETIDATHLVEPSTGQVLINFCGNDYLGLRTHPALTKAFSNNNTTFLAGAGAARLVSGNHPLHEQLEQALADFLQRDSALLFSTGYVANLAVIQALTKRGDSIIQDRLCHASLVDGARLADGRLLRYRHLDTDHCLQQLQKASGLVLLATDGVFSMDGDVAPVNKLATLANHHRGLLLVDDAHGIGVLGATGRGLLEQANLGQSDVPLLTGTFGKSMGLAGAFVAGDHELITYLRNFARGWIYSTAPPLPLVQAQLRALQLIQDEPQRRAQLHQNINHFTQLAVAANLPLLTSNTAIQPLLVGDAQKALSMQTELHKRGFYIAAIRPPTVPKGTARLRITLNAEHTEDMITTLIHALTEINHAN